MLGGLVEDDMGDVEGSGARLLARGRLDWFRVLWYPVVFH